MHKSLRHRKHMLYDETVGKFDLKENIKDIENHGQIHMERKKKDLLWAMMFFSFVASMWGMGIDGFVVGNRQKMLNPYDGDLNFCGLDPGFEDYPMLYLTNLAQEDPDKIFKSGVCLKECP